MIDFTRNMAVNLVYNLDKLNGFLTIPKHKFYEKYVSIKVILI